MNKQLILGVGSLLFFCMALMFAHIAAACTGGLGFFYGVWSLVFSIGTVVTTLVALDIA